MNTVNNNLDTFRILWIVKGVLNLLVCLFFILYIFFGIFIWNVNDPDFQDFNPGILVMIIGGIGLVLTAIFGALTLLTAKYIKEKRGYNFILVMSVLNCLSGVLGILLGVFTIIEINKPHVKELFDKAA